MSRESRLQNQGRRVGYMPSPAKRQQEHDRHDAKRVPKPKRPKPEVVPATEDRITMVHRRVDPLIALQKFGLGEADSFPKDLELPAHSEDALQTGRGKRQLNIWARSYSSSFRMLKKVLDTDHEISVRDCDDALLLGNNARETLIDFVIPSSLSPAPAQGIA